jgi:hypothetical protein
MLRKKKNKQTKCAIPSCWQPAKTSGFCGACYSPVYRLRDMHMGDIANYYRRTTRIQNRAAIEIKRRGKR